MQTATASPSPNIVKRSRPRWSVTARTSAMCAAIETSPTSRCEGPTPRRSPMTPRRPPEPPPAAGDALELPAAGVTEPAPGQGAADGANHLRHQDLPAPGLVG